MRKCHWMYKLEDNHFHFHFLRNVSYHFCFLCWYFTARQLSLLLRYVSCCSTSCCNSADALWLINVVTPTVPLYMRLRTQRSKGKLNKPDHDLPLFVSTMEDDLENVINEGEGESYRSNLDLTAESSDFLKIASLLKTFAESGAPSHKVEFLADHLRKALGVDVICIASPNHLLLTFNGGSSVKTTQTTLVPLQRKDSIYTLETTHELLRSLISGQVQLSDVDLESVRHYTPYPEWVTFSTYCLDVVIKAAVFFSPSWKAVVLVFLNGLIVALLALAGRKLSQFRLIYRILAAFVSSFFTRAVVSWGWLADSCEDIVKVASISDIMPGMSITMSVMELAHDSLYSGTARLFGAIVQAFLLGFGLAYGKEAVLWYTSEDSGTPRCPDPIDSWFLLLFVPLMLVLSTFKLDAGIRRLPIVALAGFLSWLLTFVLKAYTDASAPIISFSASFVVGLLGGLWQRFTGSIAMTPIIAGISVVLPGGIAVRGVENFLEGRGEGEQFGFEFVSVAISISMGLFCAAVVSQLLNMTPTRVWLRSEWVSVFQPTTQHGLLY